jgi:hypothetical protein
MNDLNWKLLIRLLLPIIFKLLEGFANAPIEKRQEIVSDLQTVMQTVFDDEES